MSLKTHEQYQCVCLSTAHLRYSDCAALDAATADNMVMKRDTGWFVKVYEESEYNRIPNGSDELSKLLMDALVAGYRMVEFDADADVCDDYPVFEWTTEEIRAAQEVGP